MAQDPNDELDIIGLQGAPLICVALDAQWKVYRANERAGNAGLIVGLPISHYLDSNSQAKLSACLQDDDKGVVSVTFKDEQSFECWYCRTTENGHVLLWLQDVSELELLRNQLKELKKPEKNFVHRINNIISTTLGYAELVDLMLEENAELSGERLSTIQRYQNEILIGLKQAEQHIHREKHGFTLSTVRSEAQRVEPKQGRQHVLIVHPDKTRLALLVELLQSENYRVTSFRDIKATREFVDLNPKVCDLAVLGEDKGLVNYILDKNSTLNVIVCVSEEHDFNNDRIIQISDNPLDINILIRTVLDLSEEPLS